MNNTMNSSDTKALCFALLCAVLYLIYQNCQNTETFAEYIPSNQPIESEIIEEDEEYEEPLEQKISAPRGYVEQTDNLALDDPSSAEIPLDSSKCGAGGAFVSSSLLPKNDESLENSFTEFSPANVKGQNFLHSNSLPFTQSQSLRNANLQIRSEPANPQEVVCPWMQSTIAPESLRPNLEIGGGCE